MNQLDGFVTASELRKLYHDRKQPQIVAVTGHVEPEFIEKAWDHGIDEFVAKPVKDDVLKKILAGIEGGDSK